MERGRKERENREQQGAALELFTSRGSMQQAGEIVGSSERAMAGLACKAEGHERTACLSVAVRDERSISPKVPVLPPVR